MMLEKQEGAAEQKRGGEDQDSDQRREISCKRSNPRPRRIGAWLVNLPGTSVMMMGDHPDASAIGIRAGDDRHRAMIEGRHEPRRRKQTHCDQQREQRCTDQSSKSRSSPHANRQMLLLAERSHVFNSSVRAVLAEDREQDDRECEQPEEIDRPALLGWNGID